MAANEEAALSAPLRRQGPRRPGQIGRHTSLPRGNDRRVRHDCGEKLGFVLANLSLALDDPEIDAKVGEAAREWWRGADAHRRG